jgi:hypothetical protein
MKILVGSWFSMPRLGREAFALLMKQGLRYDKALGFKFGPETDLESVVRTISTAVGEEVELILRCFICGKEACPGCPYLDVCDRRKVSSLCLCGEHAQGEGAYDLYREAVAGTLPN